MSGQYDDIIHLPHPDSPKHPRMSLYDRAAQFSPFAALTGHSAAIAETGRMTDQRMELDEYEMARVDAELQRLQELLPGRPTASITYFVPDERKNGGSYQTVTGEVKRIDAVNGTNPAHGIAETMLASFGCAVRIARLISLRTSSTLIPSRIAIASIARRAAASCVVFVFIRFSF